MGSVAIYRKATDNTNSNSMYHQNHGHSTLESLEPPSWVLPLR